MQLEGIYVPLVTPFDAAGALDLPRLASLVEAMVGHGVAGLVACGTTGEYYALDDGEREQVLTTIHAAAAGRVQLIAGIGDLSTRRSVEHAARARAIGYQATMLSVPPYSLPDQTGLQAHFEHVATHSELPLILYNFPARTGVDIEFDTVRELARHPNIIGIKESSGDFSRGLRLLQANLPDFQVICGCDDQPVDYFFWGARSWIAGAANVFPAEQVALHRAAMRGDWDQARDLMTRMYPALQSMEAGEYNQKAKAASLKGSFDAGDVRAPLSPLSEAEKEAFRALVHRV